MRSARVVVFVVLTVCATGAVAQQAPQSGPQQVHANLNQLMRGVLYPAAGLALGRYGPVEAQNRIGRFALCLGANFPPSD